MIAKIFPLKKFLMPYASWELHLQCNSSFSYVTFPLIALLIGPLMPLLVNLLAYIVCPS